jgi:glutathione reductase (NADPH)
MSFDYDLFVIGAGSGGVRAARMAARHGAKVAIAEDTYLGGTCVNVGCVPKKLFVYASEFSHAFDEARGFGWQSEQPGFDWLTLISNKNSEIARLNGVYSNLLQDAGVEVFEGRATIVGPNQVSVGAIVMTAARILIAVGGRPSLPNIPGIENAISSDDVFYLENLPKKILIVGGGYIAVEFACIFNGLGVESHVLYRRDKLLRGFDEDLRDVLAEEMRTQGIHLHFETNITGIEKDDQGQLTAALDSGEEMTADCILFATGRSPRTDGLGLENTGVTVTESGAIEVDEHFQTGEPGVYALGDVIDRVQLTPVAISEAMVLVQNLFAGGGGAMDYTDIPTAVFTYPQIGTVGLTEAEAREHYPKVKIFRTRFRNLKQTLGGGKDRIMMKLVVDGASDRVLGCHMVGDAAGEIIQGLAVAIKAGATKAQFDATIGIHPTMAEEFVTMRDPVDAT